MLCEKEWWRETLCPRKQKWNKALNDTNCSLTEDWLPYLSISFVVHRPLALKTLGGNRIRGWLKVKISYISTEEFYWHTLRFNVIWCIYKEFLHHSMKIYTVFLLRTKWEAIFLFWYAGECYLLAYLDAEWWRWSLVEYVRATSRRNSPRQDFSSKAQPCVF